MARYLILGHVTRDLTPQGFRFGGAVLYGGLSARRLGFETTVITACAEPDLPVLFPELSFYILPAEQTTLFENIETPTGREQKVHKTAAPLKPADLPQKLRRAEVVHLAPVLNEIPPEAIEIFSADLLVSNPQGWFRRVLPQGEIVPKAPDFKRFPHFDAVVVSTEDLAGQKSWLSFLRTKASLLVLTQGALGATLFYRNQETFFPATPVSPVVDTTGAGDVLAAAFFSALYAGKAPEEALRLAMCMARITVTREGLAGVPTPSEISLCLDEPLKEKEI